MLSLSRMIFVAFEAKARAAETERRLSMWRAHMAADLTRTAYHAPNKFPTLQRFLEGPEKPKSGAERRSFMKGLAAKHGRVIKRGKV